MSYDGVFIVPAVALGTLLGLLGAVVSGRARPVLAGLALLSAALPACFGVDTADSNYVMGELRNRTQGSWSWRHASARAMWESRKIARAYLPWAGIPFCVGSIVLIAWYLQRERRGWRTLAPWLTAGMLALPGVPLVRLVWTWYRPIVNGLWTPGDRRWTLGYIEESRQEGDIRSLLMYCKDIERGLVWPETDEDERSALKNRPPDAVPEDCKPARVIDLIELTLQDPGKRRSACSDVEDFFTEDLFLEEPDRWRNLRPRIRKLKARCGHREPASP